MKSFDSSSTDKEVKCEYFKHKYNVNCKSQTDKYPGIGIRHLQSILLAFGVFCGYLQRVNLSVTIVAITNTNKTEKETMLYNERNVPVYTWNNEIRSYILSAFFIGYLITNFPAAVLGVHISNKLLLTLTFLSNGIISCLIPSIIEYRYRGSNEFFKYINDIAGYGNWRALIIVRIVQGMLQAFMFPTIHAIIARWATPNERSRLVGFIMSGIPFGTAVTLAGSGLLVNTNIGWPSVFYISGFVGIMWGLIWSVLGSNSPDESRAISISEYSYLSEHIAVDSSENKRKVPWKSIFISWHVWAIVIAHAGHNWGFWLLLSEMPTFIHSVLDFDIKSDGLFSALPYLGMWAFQIPVMFIADNFNKRGITTISMSRKLWNTIGMWGATFSLVVLGYLDNNADVAIILYIVTVTIGCCVNVGFNVNHMDLTPNYAGVLMGISNGFAATGGLGAPLMVASIVKDINSVEQWRIVFYVGAAITFFCNLFFIICGSGKTEQWNDKEITTNIQCT